jgi:septal ring factor EnvC (AmiA/AmiB activator)
MEGQTQGGWMGMMQMMQNCPMMRGMMQGGQTEGGMMGGMEQMHGRMMENPRMRSLMMVHLLPTLKDSLNLSGEQTARLREEKKQFKKERAALQEEQKEIKKRLEETIAEDQPDLDHVNELLADRADLEADQEFAIYETAARMKEVLSEAQREKLAALEPREMHRAMMANMSMMEMMQMMRTMHDGQMMMDSMMQGGQMPMDGQMPRENKE